MRGDVAGGDAGEVEVGEPSRVITVSWKSISVYRPLAQIIIKS